MNGGVPSITQLPDMAYVFLKAMVRMIGSRSQSWIENKKSIEILIRVLNLGPDVVDKLTREIPLVETIKYKAELLGITDCSSVVLPEFATGWMFRDASLSCYVAALQQLGIISDRNPQDHLTPELSVYRVDMEAEKLNRQCRNSDATFTPARLPIWLYGEEDPAKPQVEYYAESWGSATLREYLDCCLDIGARAKLSGMDPKRAVYRAFGVKRKSQCTVRFFTPTIYRAPGFSEKRLYIVFWPEREGGHVSFTTEEAYDSSTKERDNGLPCLHTPYVGYMYPSDPKATA